MLKFILYPFYWLFISFPHKIQLWILEWKKQDFKITRPYCLFIINPKSGKQLGKKLYKILPQIYDRKYILNLIKDDHVGRIQALLQEIPKDKKLNVIIAGGDGTVSSLIQEYQQKIKEYERLVFLPFPLGVGNDLSMQLNFGGNMDIYYLTNFFNKLNSTYTREFEMDSWTVTFDYGSSKVEKLMMLYFGVGCDGAVAKTLDTMRKKFPFMFVANKITRLFYAFSHIRHWIPQWVRGVQSVRMGDLKFYLDGVLKDISGLANLIFINTFSRQGGICGEWDDNLKLEKYKDSGLKKRSETDRIFEIFSLRDYNQLAWVTLKLQRIDNFAQGKEMRLEVGNRKLTYHIDGEPNSIFGPVDIQLKYRGKVRVLKYFEDN